MTAFFISSLAVLTVLALFGDGDTCPETRSRRQSQSSGLTTLLAMSALVWTTTNCIASPQATTPDPPAKPTAKASTTANGNVSSIITSQDGKRKAAVEIVIKNGNDQNSVTSKVEIDGEATDISTAEVGADSSDILYVITKDGLNRLIAASGGDIEAFDLDTLKQASAFMPLSLSQSRALSPVLRTAASPMMLKRLFNPTNLKVIQGLLENSYQKPKAAVQPIDHAAWDQFLKDNSWIENPGIGQVVTKTGMVEADRPAEIAKEVQTAIEEAVAARIQNLASEKYGVSDLDTSEMDFSFFDPSKAIAQTAQWQEQLSESGSSNDVMVQTHVLVDLPKNDIDTLMAGVKTELQKERLAAVAITIGLFWLGIALSSIAFRTYHSKSRIWKMVVIPALTLAVIPCLVGAGLMIGEMTTGNLF